MSMRSPRVHGRRWMVGLLPASAAAARAWNGAGWDEEVVDGTSTCGAWSPSLALDQRVPR